MKDRLVDWYFKNKRIINIICISLILVIILLLIILIKPDNNEEKPVYPVEEKITLTLKGMESISILEGEEYIEPGFYAITSKGIDKTKEVIVSSNLDVNKPGIYTITYKIGDILLKRYVKVLEKEEEIGILTFNLKGEDTITLNLGDNYVEPGFVAYDTVLGDLSSGVLVSGSVNTSKVGRYTLTYKVSNGEDSKELTRIVIVQDDRLVININSNKTNYTNSNITLNISILGDSFKYLVLPNKVVVEKQNTTYEVSNNGTYEFIAYNESGDVFKKSITINNIDKTKPNGTCTATINQTNTIISVSSSDNVGIKNHIYLDSNSEIGNTSNKTYTYNKKTSKNVSVKIFDVSGNYNLISCKIVDKSFLEPIKPTSSENIIKQSETDILKVYISKKSNYYLTRVWAYNPYNQLKKYDSPEYGSTLYRPKKLLEMAISDNNLSSKLLVGFNASGFYLKDTYDADSVDKYSKYNKTSVGTLVITNGKVIRNWYDKAYKTWFITGIDKNNNLRIFKDSKASTTNEINAKKNWANEVINSGIKNTFTFASPLIENGVKSTTTTSMPSTSSNGNRQAICQVNTNNFVLITGSELTRNELIDIMLDLKCQTGTNLDGGGSIALFFKDESSNLVETIIGNNRSLTEVAYFTE